MVDHMSKPPFNSTLHALTLSSSEQAGRFVATNTPACPKCDTLANPLPPFQHAKLKGANTNILKKDSKIKKLPETETR